MLGGLWLLMLTVASAVIAGLTGYPLRLVLFDVASALGNVGLSTGIVGPDLGGPAKITFIAVMYLGRLELLAALLLAVQEEHA